MIDRKLLGRAGDESGGFQAEAALGGGERQDIAFREILLSSEESFESLQQERRGLEAIEIETDPDKSVLRSKGESHTGCMTIKTWAMRFQMGGKIWKGTLTELRMGKCGTRARRLPISLFSLPPLTH